jgi:thiosulfate/3-mercaptopyruvate sulfurtransferase
VSPAYTTLIAALDLAAHLHDPDWVVIDCRFDLTNPEFGVQAWRRSHIEGAFFLDIDIDLCGPRTGRNGRHPLPDPVQLAARLGACGIDAHTQIVVYDDTDGMFAARLWWLMRWLGHQRVAVLDGGLQAWCRAGQALDEGRPHAVARRYVPTAAGDGIDADYVLAHLGRPDMLLLDARSPDRFRGENEMLDPVGGHVPGAINRYFRDNLAEDGCFKPAAQLRAEFDAVLAGQAAAQVVHQCGSGVTACHNLLAMEVAGLGGSRLYAGSWSEWCADPARPIATGPA